MVAVFFFFTLANVTTTRMHIFYFLCPVLFSEVTFQAAGFYLRSAFRQEVRIHKCYG